MSINKVILIGRLGKDPELTNTNSGKAVVNFSLATSEYTKDQAGQKQEKTEWHRVTAWERTAEVIGEYCKQGSQIYIEGSLQTRKYQGKDGLDRYATEIVARNIQLLDKKENEAPQQEFVETDVPF